MNTVPLNLNKIVELMELEFNLASPKEIDLLRIAMQSIAKRIDYCNYHYQEFSRNSCDMALLQESLDNTHNGRSIRVIYEASVIAFLQNLHSLIDSYPYALNLIDRKCENIDSSSIGWKENFIIRYNNLDYIPELRRVFENPIYQNLRGLVNRTKHKHLVRIKNTGERLIFEEFSYKVNEKNITIEEQDVNQFIVECYKNLLDDFLTLCNAVEKSKEKN